MHLQHYGEHTSYGMQHAAGVEGHPEGCRDGPLAGGKTQELESFNVQVGEDINNYQGEESSPYGEKNWIENILFGDDVKFNAKALDFLAHCRPQALLRGCWW